MVWEVDQETDQQLVVAEAAVAAVVVVGTVVAVAEVEVIVVVGVSVDQTNQRKEQVEEAVTPLHTLAEAPLLEEEELHMQEVEEHPALDQEVPADPWDQVHLSLPAVPEVQLVPSDPGVLETHSNLKYFHSNLACRNNLYLEVQQVLVDHCFHLCLKVQELQVVPQVHQPPYLQTFLLVQVHQVDPVVQVDQVLQEVLSHH